MKKKTDTWTRSHLKGFKYPCSNFQTPVNIFGFNLCDAVEQSKNKYKCQVY